MANPVLNDKRFTAAADDFEPGWAAPTRSGRRRPRRLRSPTDRGDDVGERDVRVDVLPLDAAPRRRPFGWSQVRWTRRHGQAPGLDLHPAVRGVRLAMACIFAPRPRPSPRRSTPSPKVCSSAPLARYEAQWSGIVLQAVLATLAVFVVCLAFYVTGAVKVTNKFIFVVIVATAGIFLMYFATFLLSIFGIDLTFWNEPSPLGIGISVVICFVAGSTSSSTSR